MQIVSSWGDNLQEMSKRILGETNQQFVIRWIAHSMVSVKWLLLYS